MKKRRFNNKVIIYKEDGFTLLEIILAVTILGIISITAVMFLYQGSSSFAKMDNVKDLTMQGQIALERMSREIRLVRCSTSTTTRCIPTSSDITSMTSAEFRFVNVNDEGRGLRFDNVGSLLLRQGSGPSDPEDALSANISGLAFTYYKKDGTQASIPSDVWLINVSITISNAGEAISFETSVHPRAFR